MLDLSPDPKQFQAKYEISKDYFQINFGIRMVKHLHERQKIVHLTFGIYDLEFYLQQLLYFCQHFQNYFSFVIYDTVFNMFAQR